MIKTWSELPVALVKEQVPESVLQPVHRRGPAFLLPARPTVILAV